MSTLGWMLELSHGLSEQSLAAIEALERRVGEHDGGRLKLEWPTLRSRRVDEVNDLLWWDSSGTRLLGFLGLYCFDSRNLECCGMVDPSVRRQGIASKLFDAAIPIFRERSLDSVLLVVPREPDPGRLFAARRNMSAEHSEHALVLTGTPTDGPADSSISLRIASIADLLIVTRLLDDAFGYSHLGLAERLAEEQSGERYERTHIILLGDQLVGTVRLTLDGEDGGVYGFAVDPSLQGRGIGRQALRQACHQLRSQGASRISLEVAVRNERALGLYTSLGFVRISTEDYYKLR